MDTRSEHLYCTLKKVAREARERDGRRHLGCQNFGGPA